MTLKECIELYQKEPGKYKGFTFKNHPFYFKIDGETFKEYNIESDLLSGTEIIFNVYDILSEEWEMIENSIPIGFIKNTHGDYIKHSSIEIWAVIYWDNIYKKEYIWGTYGTKETADFMERYLLKRNTNSQWKYIKTLHLTQQYSINLEDTRSGYMETGNN